MPPHLQTPAMAHYLTIISLVSILASMYGLEEQVKQEIEIEEGTHSCQAGHINTDWGTATKYLAVQPTNRNVSEKDVFTMAREFICSANAVIAKTEARLREEAEITKAALDQTITIIQGILATCSTLTGFLTLACCMSRRGPAWLNLAHLPAAAGQHRAANPDPQPAPLAGPQPIQLQLEMEPPPLLHPPASVFAFSRFDRQARAARMAEQYLAMPATSTRS